MSCGTTSTAAPTLAASVAVGTTTFTDSGLSQQGTISYSVKAVDAAGNVSSASTTARPWSTTSPSRDAHRHRAGLDERPARDRLVGVTDPPCDGSTWRATRSTATACCSAARPRPPGSTYTDASVLAEGDYVYTVKAFDGAGNASTASTPRTVVIDLTPPGAPGAITASCPTSAKPSLVFASATDTGGSGIKSYEVYRGSTLAGTTPASPYLDSGATTNATIAYTVRAIDNAGNAGPLTAVATVVYDTTAPPAPVNLTGATPTSRQAGADVEPGGADNLSGLVRYDVLRGGTVIGSTAPGATFTDTARPSSGAQSYTVKAVDAAGNASQPLGRQGRSSTTRDAERAGQADDPSPAIHPR